MKFWRLGPIEFGEQSRWVGRAPQNKGLWAFPYPFYDSFFTYHRYMDLLPKQLRENGSYEEHQEWIQKIGRKVLPLREFWYKGEVFTHFTPTGEIGDSGLFGTENMQWTSMNVVQLNKHIASSGGSTSFYRDNKENKLERIRTTVDHLEIFIAPNMGILKTGSTPPRK